MLLQELAGDQFVVKKLSHRVYALHIVAQQTRIQKILETDAEAKVAQLYLEHFLCETSYVL